MEKRRLGRTGLEVTVVGLGGAPLSRETCTDAEALETVWASLEGGANLIDTSPHYGLGRSETLIGRALQERPDLAGDVVLSTKTGHYGQRTDYSYDGTMRSIERSLGRLGVSYLPIVHIHDVWSADNLRDIVRRKAAHAALRQLQAEGVVGSIGIGTKDLGALQFAVDSREFDVLMMANQYNLLEQAGQAIIEKAAENDVGVMIAGAYATGILVKGSVDPKSRYRYRLASPHTRERVAALEEICRKWGCSLPAAAVQFCLRCHPNGLVTVLGARTRQQARENVGTVEEDIALGLWAELQAWLGAGDADQPNP